MIVFVDTSAWCALADTKDRNHVKAIDILRKIKDQGICLITSDYVLDETLTLLRFKLGHSIAKRFGEEIFASKVCRLSEIDAKLRQKSWDIFVRYDDKSFSFTDCSSFALMNDLEIKAAFAFDVHFRQYGFTLL